MLAIRNVLMTALIFFNLGTQGVVLRGRGMAIVMVEHIMEAIIELSDHVIVLASGKHIAEGTPQEVTSDPDVIEAYLGTD